MTITRANRQIDLESLLPVQAVQRPVSEGVWEVEADIPKAQLDASAAAAPDAPARVIARGRDSSGVVDALISPVTVANNTLLEETAASLTVPATQAPAADTKIRVESYGLVHCNPGGNVTFTVRLKLDGTTVFTASPVKNSSGNYAHFRASWDIACASASAQRIFSLFELSSNVGALGVDSDVGAVRYGYGESTVDMSGATTVEVTAQASVAHRSVDMLFQSTTIEVVRPLP